MTASRGGTSVVLATCEGERFLPGQLASLLAQRRLPYEVVVADDASTDGTRDLLRAFEAEAPFPVRLLLRTERLGAEENFLDAAGAASGRWLAWCDQDDVWSPRKLLVCESVLRATRAAAVIHAAMRIDERGRQLGRPHGVHPPLQRRLAGDRHQVPHGMRQVVDRRVLELLPPQERPRSTAHEIRQIHDEWSFSAANAVGPIVWLPVHLTGYRVHEDNLTGAPRLSSVLQRTTALREDDIDERRALVSEERSTYLRHGARAAADEALRARLDDAATAYAGIAAAYRQREAVRGARGRMQTAHAFLRLLRGGTYRRASAGGLGLRSAVRDSIEVLRR